MNNRENILRTLAYFDIFQYPLTREELFNFHAAPVLPSLLDETIEALLHEQQIFQLDEFYSLQQNIALAARRRSGNRCAITEMKNAGKAARILSKFPYVKGLAISGSLSKNYADENTDVDFFIITQNNRLWIARTLMHLFYKLAYITGKQRWFCMNYYVDESGLEISEKNIFTAMEIVTLIPMVGSSSLNAFTAANLWTKKFFPLMSQPATNPHEIKKGSFGRLLERVFNNRIGDRIDNLLMTITDRRWKKKTLQNKKTKKGSVMGMMVGKHYSKPDPRNFQQKVIERYYARINSLLAQQLQC